LAIPQERWLQCVNFIARGAGLSVSLVGTPDQLRTAVRNAIIAGGVSDQPIDTVITVAGRPHGLRSAYTVRGTYERMFGFDLITDLPNGL
jgi:hypothetical protein